MVYFGFISLGGMSFRKARLEVEDRRCCSISDEGRTAGGCGVSIGSVLGLKLREQF